MLVARPSSSAAPGSPSSLNAVGGQLIPSAGPRDPAFWKRSRGAMRSVRIHQNARGRAQFVLRLLWQHIVGAVAWLRCLASRAAPMLRRASQRWQNRRDDFYTAQQRVSAPKAELASVHRHTRKITRVSSNRMDGPSGTPQSGGTVDRTSQRSRHETPRLAKKRSCLP